MAIMITRIVNSQTPKKMFSVWRVLVFTIILLAGGCATLPQDMGRRDVDILVSDRSQSGWAASTEDRYGLVEALANEPLTAENAIRIALVNNPMLQAEYARLGFAAADVYEAGRIRNPVFSGSFLDSNQSGDSNLNTVGLVASFTDLLTLSARKWFAKAEFEITKQKIAASVLSMAADAESAYYHFVAAKQMKTLRIQIAKASKLSLELAQRYHVAGNLTPRDLALEKAAAAEARLAVLAADDIAYAARTDLAMVLGLSAGGNWDAPAQLPVPLTDEDDLANLLILAHKNRLDLSAATAQVDILTDRLGVTGWTRWLGELGVGFERERETDGTRLTGPTIDWEIPVFTQNRDRMIRLEAELQIALNEWEHLLISVDNDVRLAHAATRNAKARVDEYVTHLLPARINAVARAQEEENFMLIGIFELLETKRQEYNAYQEYLEVVRDYWIMRVELAQAVGTTLPSSANITEKRIDVDDYVRPKQGGMHSGHGAMGKTSDGSKMDHSKHGAMDHQKKTEIPMDHSKHEGMDHQKKTEKPTDHSKCEGMDHSAHKKDEDATKHNH